MVIIIKYTNRTLLDDLTSKLEVNTICASYKAHVS